jgi:3'-5' exoribonuclease
LTDERIAELTPGSAVEGRYLVARKEVRQGGRAGVYLDLTLMDATGRAPAKVWENAAEVAEWFQQGDVVAVEGRAETYRGELQLRLDSVRAVPADEASPTDFLPRSKKDLVALEQRLAEVVKSIGSADLRALLLGFFSDPDFRRSFFAAPGAKAMHHAYVGGLAEHTLEVVEVCLCVAEVFPPLDRDLLLTAAILHDIGKMEELRWDTAFDYTDLGQLVGHIVLGEQRVRQAMEAAESFPEELKLRLSHMLLSHHGTREYGSPVEPMTAEAIALHHAEDLGAKVNLYLTNINAAREQGRRWTERHFRLNRALFVGDENGAEAESEAGG